MSGDLAQLGFGVTSGTGRHQAFQQPLCYQVGVAAVGRGGMRVVVNRQSKMTFLFSSRSLDDVFARTEQFYN